SSTSTKTTPGASRFFSAQSAETSAVSRLIESLPDEDRVGEPARGDQQAGRTTLTHRRNGSRACATAPLPGLENFRGYAAQAAPPSDDGATETGGHAAQVDRAPLGEKRPHDEEGYQAEFIFPRC